MAHVPQTDNLQDHTGSEFLAVSTCSQQYYLESLCESQLHKVALDSFKNTTAFVDKIYLRMILRTILMALWMHNASAEAKIPFSMWHIFLSIKLKIRKSDTTEVLQFEGRFHVNCSIKSEKKENKGIIYRCLCEMGHSNAHCLFCSCVASLLQCPSPTPYPCRIRLTQ